SSVSVYSPERHFLPLARMTPELIGDNLASQVEFVRAVMRADDEAVWASVNANHMLPAGSSVFHPHLQGSVNPTPTTFQRLLADVAERSFVPTWSPRSATGRAIPAAPGTSTGSPASLLSARPSYEHSFRGLPRRRSSMASSPRSLAAALRPRSAFTRTSASRASTWPSTEPRSAPPTTRSTCG